MTPFLPALIWLAVAQAQEPIDAPLPVVTQRIYQEGRSLEARGDHAAAAVRYRAVAEMEPGWTQALVDLGRVLEAEDRFDEAIATYERAPYDADVLEALGRLALRLGDTRRAVEAFHRFRDLESGLPRYLVLEAHALAAVDPLAARSVLFEFLDRPGATLATEDGLAAATAIAVALHQAGEDEACREVVDRTRARLDEEGQPADDPARAQLAELADRFAVEDEALRLARAEDAPLDGAERRRLAEARALLREGRSSEARELLERLVADAPRSAVAWGALADAAEATGDVERAYRAATTAERLDPLDPVHPARLGDLLVDGFAGRYDAEAATAYARALARPGAPSDLWFRRGLAELSSDQPGAAVASLRRFVAVAPDDRRADQARALIDGLGRTLPEPTPEAGGKPALDDTELGYWVAVVLARPPRGSPVDLDRALVALDAVLAAEPDDTRALDLAADVRSRRGEADAAIALLERSLAIAPGRGPVLARLGDLYGNVGRAEDAEAMLLSAAEHGDPGASLTLAERDLAAWRLWEAARRLDALDASGRLDPAHEGRFAELRAATNRRTGWLAGGGVVGVGLVAAVPIARVARRRLAAPLERLLDAHPTVWPEVARVLSAVRHEVLKHHCSTLDAVADAIEGGDPEPGRWAAGRLEGPGGAIARFRDAVRGLERLARLHGVRVDLRLADPVFGPLIAAMDRLEGLLPDLRRGATRVVGPLRGVSESLNGPGYQALGHLLQRLCLQPLDAEVIGDSWRKVTSEARVDQDLDLDLPDDLPRLRIYRGELDDVLTNLLRNALEASAGEPAPNVGVRVSTEEDPITGLERVEIRVRDRARKRLSTAMIRSRSIGRGLGLAVDLVTRNGGSIHVEDEPGWSKAVVVRLPRAEFQEEAS